MKHSEAILQTHCFKYFRLKYPHLAWLYFAIPNGGSRNIIEAAGLKRQGVLSGVADSFLALPHGEYHGLWIEYKVGKNGLTANQKKFMSEVENQGYAYAVVITVDEFIKTIETYLKCSSTSKYL